MEISKKQGIWGGVIALLLILIAVVIAQTNKMIDKLKVAFATQYAAYLSDLQVVEGLIIDGTTAGEVQQEWPNHYRALEYAKEHGNTLEEQSRLEIMYQLRTNDGYPAWMVKKYL